MKAQEDYKRAYSTVREALRDWAECNEEAVDAICFFNERPPLRVNVTSCFVGLPVVLMYGGLADEMAQTLKGKPEVRALAI